MRQPVTHPSTNTALADRYAAVRAFSERLCGPLATEDYVAQSMPDVSPTKWHIAHVTWFFETFLLRPQADYQVFHPQFEVLFNSYYNAVGEQFPRARRGLLTRPTVADVLAYRAHVDSAMLALLAENIDPATRALIELGLNHEQQHQELLLMDIKHVLFQNPLYPAYRRPALSRADAVAQSKWHQFAGGERDIGHAGDGFAFDNEGPRHPVLLQPYQLADRLVTNAEYLAFIEDAGYQSPTLWLADGWAQCCEQNWQSPLYWVKRDDEWFEFTLYGLQALDPHRPVCHVSLYEADAYASWASARLPTELEWEAAAASAADRGQLLGDDTTLHPQAAHGGDEQPKQLLGDCWEWTRSAYQPYPGFAAPAGAVGEYNGKFMVNQMVLRGGACVTPANHIRPTYRNFFYPHMRWQFGGIRLAR